MTDARADDVLQKILRLASDAPPALGEAVIPILLLGAEGVEPLSPALEARVRAFFLELGVSADAAPEEVKARIDVWCAADPARASWIDQLQEVLDAAGAAERGARLGRGAASLGMREDLRPAGQREAPEGSLRGGGGLVELFMRRKKAP